jgi:hypothetical protein
MINPNFNININYSSNQPMQMQQPVFNSRGSMPSMPSQPMAQPMYSARGSMISANQMEKIRQEQIQQEMWNMDINKK